MLSKTDSGEILTSLQTRMKSLEDIGELFGDSVEPINYNKHLDGDDEKEKVSSGEVEVTAHEKDLKH